ncbi:hypothetical protein T459_04994 [Capsicum annuum]|uniref:Uncharacterized protein n=1 Tax=Capsicum annuum TaxID=4072 RepID=A0A2G3A6R5_CAPAN|nr:hypothetical protein T459_04994 [Capsicum annuum]
MDSVERDRSWPPDEALKSHGLGDSLELLLVRFLLASAMALKHSLFHVLTFRQGSSELFPGLVDRSIKIWNVEDRTYVLKF